MSDCYSPEPLPTEYGDLDGDGFEETTLIDSDGDGYHDTRLTDVDGDGLNDIAEFDNAPDEEFVADVVAVDATGDGVADVVFDDLNFDGTYDTVTHDVGVPLEDANPYGPQYTGEPYEGGHEGAIYDLPSTQQS